MNLKKVTTCLRAAESVVLTLIAIVLVVLATLLLATSVKGMASDMRAGTLAGTGIVVLNSILFVMMIMEIVYTVTKSLESHTLVAEPFLIIGVIAAIRRMLVITTESTKLELTHPEAFRSLLIELALLAVIVVAVAFAIWILRQSIGGRNIVFYCPQRDSRSLTVPGVACFGAILGVLRLGGQAFLLSPRRHQDAKNIKAFFSIL